jgi:hypothetical protein
MGREAYRNDLCASETDGLCRWRRDLGVGVWRLFPRRLLRDLCRKVVFFACHL